ncbi:MAG: coproporphyrinogen dehydrogenase HemZ [Clostridia bacterium]|nr:coproporphyrinogen dehydrogenase HemZ [Clostridia bacterium]
MRLILDGNINSLYVQSLCMMFFRGEKFPKDEQNPRGILYVKLEEGAQSLFCYSKLTYDGMESEGSFTRSLEGKEKFDRLRKTVVGTAVLEACSKLTGYNPPWGLLTGIRPSVVASELMEQCSEGEAQRCLEKDYLLSASKARLALEVAKNENQITKKYGNDTCSIYISIPFCPTRCTYCSFISYATKNLFKLIPDYVERLKQDILNTFEAINELGLTVSTVYVGGGTPTTLDCEQLEVILSTVSVCLDGRRLNEFTVEGGRPDTINKEKLSILKKYGVTRISVNPQTLNDTVLESIGRRHTEQDFYNAFELVKKSDFSVVNTDLIAGLEKDTFDSFVRTVDKIVELNPENITVHSFSVKKSAQILQNDKDIYHKNGDYAVQSVDYAYEKLTKCGYVPYYMYRQKNTVSDLENVGYAKVGTFCDYNVLMMGDGHTVFGVGAGSTTKLVKNIGGKKEILRIFRPKYPYEYLQDNQSNFEEIIRFMKGGT